ncbi:MAG: nucleotidyltransferase family protein [Gemmatimonadaceae bacterium]|nr:nucleotidyltransferase family protein [Gemmatimonadaceae bacterium]
MTELLNDRREILRIAAEHGARNLRVFGSVARDEARPDSDLDLLVDMEDGRSLLDLVGLGQDLEALLKRRVDVVTANSVHSAIRASILSDARPL